MVSPRPSAVFLAVLLWLPVTAGAEDRPPGASGPVTLEHVLGRKRLARSLPAWSWRPGHTELVRLEQNKRRRTLHVMDPVSGDARELLDLLSLEAMVDRRPIGQRRIGRPAPATYVWAADGRSLCVVVKGDLVWVDLEKGTRRRLTTTPSPLADVKIAPDDSHVSFSRDHDLWVVSTSEGVPRRLTQGGSEDILNASLDWVYPEELSLHTAAWWSPDSKRIAWLQLDETGVSKFPLPAHLSRLSELKYVRYPKAGDRNPVPRVGVVRCEGGETTWLDLGTPAPEYVCRVAWFPRGRHVAVVTLDRPQRHLKLLACPVDGGPPVSVLEETDPAWVDVPPAPHFVDDTRFLWRSHRDGATRWYLVTTRSRVPTSTSAVPLTGPGIDVSSRPFFEPASGRILYAGTKHGTPTSRIYRGRLGRSREDEDVGLSLDADFTVSAVPDPSGRFAIVTSSSPTTPPRRELRRLADGELIRSLGNARSKELDEVALAVPESGVFEDGATGPIVWRLWKPADFDPTRRYPLIVRVYGGPGSRMIRGGWGGGIALTTYFTQMGFLVAEFDGRGTRGFGTAHERAVQGRLGELEVEDQVRGVRLLSGRPYVDGDRVGITGWSYGGTVTCMALTRHSDVFKVGVAVAPVTNWRLYDTIYTERYMGTPAENPKGYEETAATFHAKTMDGHLLLLHGTADDNVHAQNTYQLVQALLEAGKSTFDVMLYPGQGHGLGGARADVYARMVAFFEEHL